MSLEYNQKNIALAKNLRKNATLQENRLWYDFLCKYEIRFQRQKSIDNFIADFYCHQARLVIEIDGSQHYKSSNLIYDAKRTSVLEKYGSFVLRFTNMDVDNEFDSVCRVIDRTVKERMTPSATL